MLKVKVNMYEYFEMNAKITQKKHDREIGHIPRHDWIRFKYLIALQIAGNWN